MSQGFSFNKKLQEITSNKGPFSFKPTGLNVNQVQPSQKFSFNMALKKLNQNQPSPFSLKQNFRSLDTSQSPVSFFHSTPVSKSTSFNLNQNTNSKQAGFFANLNGASSNLLISNQNLNEDCYTGANDLAQRDIEQYKSNKFSFIPLNPPPKELCF